MTVLLCKLLCISKEKRFTDIVPSDPSDRPIADVLLSQHPFCELDNNYNFLDTELYAKIRGAY